jgi:putative restriction endonuclease
MEFRGYIGVTDLGWASLLRADQRAGDSHDEVNFWRPSERFFGALRPGEPYFFRLKSPVNAIGGMAFFQRSAVLPVWLAWECFGRGNGVESLREFEDRLREIRRRNKIENDPELRIGCTLLSQPVFFDEPDYVRLPSDWGPRTVSGAGYDMRSGEGARVFAECHAVWQRMQSGYGTATKSPQGVLLDGVSRFGATQLVAPRLGQGGFRVAVTEAYRRQCAVTTEHSLPVLEAAHIRPYAETGSHEVSNGLLLRSDIHRLFDRGYVTVTPDYRFRVSSRLREEYRNGRVYYELDGREIVLPEDRALWPARDLLAERSANWPR